MNHPRCKAKNHWSATTEWQTENFGDCSILNPKN